MTTKKMTWDQAIRHVLVQERKPMHYKEVADRIMSAEPPLVETKTATPEIVVGTTLSLLAKDGNSGVIKPSGARGIYMLKTGSDGAQSQLVEAEEETNLTDEEELEIIKVSAYGLFWERDKVCWNPGKGKSLQYELPGTADGADSPVDFGGQAGVYILYNGAIPVYVGRTTKDHLFKRLQEHTIDKHKSRWNRFSWFGFRAVNEESGQLSTAEEQSFSTSQLIEILETVIIEGFILPSNNKAGDSLGTLYRQFEAPEVTKERHQEIVAALKAVL